MEIFMHIKKITLWLCILLILPLASSCSREQPEEAVTTRQATDWRNQIEYDGSFYVSEDIKLLYSLDKGTITLWDDGGDGEMLQRLSYETTAADAMENLIREDINGDGYVDLQTIYDEAEGEACYNLWLWNAADGQYQTCSMYRLLKNPQPDPTAGSVSSQYVTEAFGTVVSTYQFTEGLDLEVVSETISDADNIAAAIALALTGDGTVVPSQGEATIDEIACAAYTVGTGETGSGAYIAYMPDGSWFVDIDCLGIYRAVEWNGETYIPGHYMEEAAEAEDLALAYASDTDYSKIHIAAKTEGRFGSSSAVQYTVESDGAALCTLCKTGQGWYISTDGAAYYALAGGEIGELSEETFS